MSEDIYFNEPGFENDEDPRAGPARRQPVAAEEYMPRLARPGIGAVIDVPVLGRVRRAGRIECQRGGNDR